MELNSKKLEKTSRLVYYSISTILCLFLILHSNNIIDDLDNVVQSPTIEKFEDKNSVLKFQSDINKNKALLENLNSKKATIEKTISAAKENYQAEKQSFDNWVQTRKTLGSPDKDQEVIDRAKKLDEYYKIEQDWRSQLSLVQNEINEKQKLIDKIQDSINNEKSNAVIKLSKEQRVYDLKVFLFRLLFVGPILGLGIFFFIKYRQNKYWPLYFGFSLFSIYAFFFGLVPYLPSYGGYVRYSVGIALSIGLGYYAIKRIRLYIEEKQKELKVSTEERANKIQNETAEKALENHFCPSCGKDFILKKWEFPVSDTAELSKSQIVTNFCRHCGLELFKNCKTCGTKNFAHLPFCSSCGMKTNSEK